MTLDDLQERMTERRRQDVTYCWTCDEVVDDHEELHCEICGRHGCLACLAEDPDTGERRCAENCYEQALEKAAKKAATSGSRDDLREYLRLRGRRIYEQGSIREVLIGLMAATLSIWWFWT